MNTGVEVSAVAPVRVACCQLEPQVGHKASNLAKTADFIERAAAEGARIIVLETPGRLQLTNHGRFVDGQPEDYYLGLRTPGNFAAGKHLSGLGKVGKRRKNCA